MCFISFQFGRAYDEGVKEYNPEENYIEMTERCQVIYDNNGNIRYIYHNQNMYTLNK